MGRVLVDNFNPVHSRDCFAENGESVQIQPGARNIPIDDRFTWKLHPDVKKVRQSRRTFETAEQEEERLTRPAPEAETPAPEEVAADDSEKSPAV